MYASRMNSRENNKENYANRLEGDNLTMINDTMNPRKRPKVYEIRTFPEGYGVLHASRMNLRENNEDISANCVERENSTIIIDTTNTRKRPKVYAIRTFPEGCGVPHASRMNSTKMNSRENDKENSANYLEGENSKMIVNTMNTRKRPKVYAIRTFPEGCGGPHTSRMDSRENNEGSSTNRLEGEDSAITPHASRMNSRKNYEESSGNVRKSTECRYFQKDVEPHASRMDSGEKYMEHSTITFVNNHRLENSAMIIDTTNPRKIPTSSIMRTTIARESPPSSIITATHVASKSPPSRISRESSPPPMADNKVPSQANDFSRNKVKYALHCFQEMLSKILEENGSRSCRADTMAAKLLKKKLKWINTAQLIGAIPGVQVGDAFEWIAELNVIGLHHQSLNGIDFMKMTNGTTLATSVVASGRYANVFESSDVLIYSGHGGNPSLKSGHPQDQRLVRGNLALKNSMEARTPVRVIRGFRFSKSCKFKRTSFKKNTVYVYDGLYYVEEYWQEKGHFGKLVFMFSLKRILGQPRLLLPWPTKQVEKL